jgi:hypothetical protein
MKCLENNDKDCVMRKIEELIKADCHNGYVAGSEVVSSVKDVVYELWLRSNDEERCKLLRMLRSLGASKTWVKQSLRVYTDWFNTWLVRCGIDWESRATRNNVVKDIEDLLRKELGWDEVKMCEELFKYIGVDVNEYRKRNVEPCTWLEGLEELSNLRNPYWLGLARSDLAITKYKYNIALSLETTNSIDAIFFLMLLGAVKTPSLKIEWNNGLARKYVSKTITLSYYIYLGPNEWPWPTELSADELKRVLDGFTDEELSMFLAGEIDGDGSVWYDIKNDRVYVLISACKDCPKRIILDVLKEIIARRFNIVGRINQFETSDALVFRGKNAVRLLRRIIRYIHHPLRRLRAELILALYDGEISKDEFTKLYEQTEYERGKDDIKRSRGLETLVRAAPQTHTHGVVFIYSRGLHQSQQ